MNIKITLDISTQTDSLGSTFKLAAAEKE